MKFVKRNPEIINCMWLCLFAELGIALFGLLIFNDHNEFSPFTPQQKGNLLVAVPIVNFIMIVIICLRDSNKFFIIDVILFIILFVWTAHYNYKIFSSIPEFQWTEEKVKLRQQLELEVCFLSIVLYYELL